MNCWTGGCSTEGWPEFETTTSSLPGRSMGHPMLFLTQRQQWIMTKSVFMKAHIKQKLAKHKVTFSDSLEDDDKGHGSKSKVRIHLSAPPTKTHQRMKINVTQEKYLQLPFYWRSKSPRGIVAPVWGRLPDLHQKQQGTFIEEISIHHQTTNYEPFSGLTNSPRTDQQPLNTAIFGGN